mmetsp:Transcript_20061/g.46725  ORF Transcript_20061/g.46725 Transcript_20061/m.46725 type:complete len:206 (-) Transcript_20061:1414-2031(-)
MTNLHQSPTLKAKGQCPRISFRHLSITDMVLMGTILIIMDTMLPPDMGGIQLVTRLDCELPAGHHSPEIMQAKVQPLSSTTMNTITGVTVHAALRTLNRRGSSQTAVMKVQDTYMAEATPTSLRPPNRPERDHLHVAWKLMRVQLQSCAASPTHLVFCTIIVTTTIIVTRHHQGATTKGARLRGSIRQLLVKTLSMGYHHLGLAV